VPGRVLCVDADRSYCEILARTFRAEGYDVHTAHDGESALAKLKTLRPDLVTLEVLLPKRDGFAVLEALRATESALRRTPVLLLTGCTATPAYRARAQQLGAVGLVSKPVALDRLLALVSRHSARTAPEPEARAPRSARPAHAPAPVKAAAKAAAPRRRPMLAGSLREVPFPALLHHLHGLRATGVLHLECGKKKKKVQVEDGRPTSVKSNLVNETLGHLLAASGRISLDVMHESLLRVKRGEGLQGQILVAMHMLDEEDLALALRTQAEEKLLEIFSWTDGTFRFDRGVRLAGGNTLSLQTSPANLIARGVLTRVPPEVIDAFFADHGEARVAPSRQPFWRFQDVDLDDGARELLARIDGDHSLIDLLPLDERSRRLLYVLSAIEMIEFVAGRPLKARAPRAETRAAEPRAAEPRAAKPAASAPRSARPAEPRAAPAAPAPPPRPSAPPPRPLADDASLSAEEERLRAELTEVAARLRGRDHFAVLGVAKAATEDQIREAYFALAKRTHPDRFSGASEAVRRVAEEVFAVISQAYETLGHRDRRNEYLRAQRDQERDRADVAEGERALKAELAFQKGIAMLRKKAHSESVELFKEAVELYAEEGEYHAYLGWALWLADPQGAGRLEVARKHLLRGAKLAPSSDKPYLFLGRLYKAEGKDGVAEKMFQKVIELDPDCVDAIRELRLIDMRRQRSKGLVRRILRR
jgi:CheY-like chemotaxis protein/tetratricopeptide (TPR) repeat protein